MSFAGFPRNVRYTPVPNPLFGQLLEQIDDLAELKCTLRVIWLIHHKKGFPRFVTQSELLADATLVRAVSRKGDDIAGEVDRALSQAVRRGTLVTATVRRNGSAERLYVTNTEAHRKALAALEGSNTAAEAGPSAEAWEAAAERPNIFSLYEDNIGMLSPMIADELKKAEEAYPTSWIEEAFREAVSQHVLKWRYIARILEQWEREGRSDGRPGRYSKKAGYQEYFRR